MTPEEIEALKKRAEDAEATAEAAKQEAEVQKIAAQNAETVNKALQDQLVKAGQEVKPDLTKIKIGNKTGVFTATVFNHNSTKMTAKEVINAKDDELIKELIAAEIIVIK